MAKYSDIKGFTVQTLSTDTVASQMAGGTWSSGGSINEARYAMGGAGLTPSAAIVFGGSPSPGSPTLSSKTESYSGTTWTEVNDMPANRAFNAGAGTSSAAVSFGGTAPGAQNDVYEWDGTNWSSNPNVYPAAYYSMAAAGTATAAIISGGNPAQTVVNTFDGTSFTSSTAMNTGRRGHGSVGTTTANLVSCGETPRTANTELWNGSSWTEVNDYPTATQDLSMWGTSTSAIGALGYDTANTANSASWDGTSWTETADLSNARNGAQTGGIGSDNTEGLVAGGDNSGRKDFTEEWSAPATFNQIQEGQLYFNSTTNAFKETLKDFTAGTWSSANGLNNGRTGVSGARNTPGHGTGLAMAGFTTPPLTARAYTEEYDGTSWSEETDANQARGQTSGTGTSASAGLLYGGETYPSPANVTNTETWNGSSWTEVNELNVAGRGMGNCGTTIAALAIAGTPEGTGSGDRGAKTEVWDGTSWTESGDIPSIPNGLSYNCAFGTTTAATTTGGGPGPAGYKRKAWSWTGSSWTETTENNSDKTGGMAFGSSADSGYAMVSSTTEFWNGTAWTESADQSTGKTEGGSGGVSESGLAFGGNNANTTTTEEFDVSLSNKTITAS